MMHSKGIPSGTSVPHQNQQVPGSNSEDKVISMCDNSSQVTVTSTPSIVVSASGPSGIGQVSQGNQNYVDSNPNNMNSSQAFLSGLLPSIFPQVAQNHPSHNGLSHVHGHGIGNMSMETQHQQQQQPVSNIHHSINPIHSIQGNPCATLPHHLMDGRHHQMNLNHQHSSHSVNHGPPHQPAHSHIPIAHHAHATHNPQQFMPFGMHMGGNGMGTGSGHSNHQITPYHTYHHGPQITNQQPAHSMNMNLNPMQQSCFMPHSACMHYQQNPQQMSTLNSQRAASNTVAWMNGPSSSSGPISNQTAIMTNNQNRAIIVPTQNGVAKIMTAAKGQVVAVSDPNAIPGGLEVLWRELPVDCQKLLVPADVPDTARLRGYFTVCELIILKRALEARYLGSVKTLPSLPSATPQHSPTSKSDTSSGSGGNKPEGHSGRRGRKRGGNKDNSGNKLAKSGNYSKENRQNQEDGGNINNSMSMTNCELNSVMHEDDENSLGELMISLDNIKSEIAVTRSSPVAEVGVGGAVKEAMETLTPSNSTADQTSNGNGEEETRSGGTGTIPKDGGQVLVVPENDSDCSTELMANDGETTHQNNNHVQVVVVRAAESEQSNNTSMPENMEQQKDTSNENSNLQLLPSMPAFSSIFPEKKTSSIVQTTMVSTPPSTTSSCMTIGSETRGGEDNGTENNKHLQLALMPNDSPTNYSSSSSNAANISTSSSCCTPLPLEGRFTSGGPPPYRTATLVLKLLQIGTYQIRSFSGVNPNRLRVIFNTQRMMYECQLPVIPAPDTGHGSPPHLIRKVLTIDIGFDQISMLRFGNDTMWMRVDGAPILSITVNSAQDEVINPILSQHDIYLLEQIEKGQLKLSPVHNLYFLNERLVHSLESQFREHPRFRHMLVDGGNEH